MDVDADVDVMDVFLYVYIFSLRFIVPIHTILDK